MKADETLDSRPFPYRSIVLLACCQALLLTNAAGLISMSALVGFSLTDVKALATLGATTYVIGSAVATMPASLWMARVGRRTGFMTGAVVNVGGCALAAVALALSSFALFCVATAVIGIYNAIGLQYRFAAAEITAPRDRAKAISLVLAGGIVGGFLGPETTRWGRDLFAVPFAGSFVLLALWALVALAVQSRVHVPKPTQAEHATGGRALTEIVRQPVFIVAAIAGGLSYGLMNLLMVATPLAMSFCSHPYAAAAMVIEWHVVGMYAPGFVTGHLIARFGVLKIISAGVAIMSGAIAVALAGDTVTHFLVALALVGVGWNFMYIGGTTLLTEAYRPAERAKTQGANDFVIFSIMGLSSFASGALVSSTGWESMNIGAIPVLAVVLAAVIWLAATRRRTASATA
ncbi:MAG TPA: MFS transporter [Casimicrobiaceae bacterium]|nr:MFS transporter [Casimicrobiaceae bacterium]